jgi:hypothetical protein
MQRTTAANYCDMTPAEFERAVVGGSLPDPIMRNGGERWHRRSLDEAFERMAGNAEPAWRGKSKLHAQG